MSLFCALCTIHEAHSVAGHWALWHRGIEQGDVSIGNLMCDPVTKRGVLNDFDLARLRVPNRVPSAADNTGTLPFLVLDLLNEQACEGLVPRLYRHDAESFTWCLIYICICMGEIGDGQISTCRRRLSSWSISMATCYFSKLRLFEDGLLKEFPYHQETRGGTRTRRRAPTSATVDKLFRSVYWLGIPTRCSLHRHRRRGS